MNAMLAFVLQMQLPDGAWVDVQDASKHPHAAAVMRDSDSRLRLAEGLYSETCNIFTGEKHLFRGRRLGDL